jgi:DNA-binding NarL/FixJ family response regulator
VVTQAVAPEPETDLGVLVCESQPVTAAGVRSLVDDHPPLKYAGACDSLSRCRELVRQFEPRAVILDKALGMQAVLDWMADLRLNGPASTAVVVWGVAMTEAEALRFLQGGAKGIIRKTAHPEQLLACLESVVRGRNWMEDSVFGDSMRQERPTPSDLTPRERQVLELVERGMKNREIARELGIRPGTVKIHLKHIFEKTGVRGRYGLALSGMRHRGLLAIDDEEGDE